MTLLSKARLFSGFRHILKAGLDPGPWTLDSGLWTLVFFPLKTLSPPKKTSISPPEKPLYLPHESPPPPINISSPKYSVRVFKQTTLFPPPTSPKKPLCLPLKTAPSQKTLLPSPKLKIQIHWTRLNKHLSSQCSSTNRH